MRRPLDSDHRQLTPNVHERRRLNEARGIRPDADAGRNVRVKHHHFDARYVGRPQPVGKGSISMRLPKSCHGRHPVVFHSEPHYCWRARPVGAIVRGDVVVDDGPGAPRSALT
jgi:hypothetical protein